METREERVARGEDAQRLAVLDAIKDFPSRTEREQESMVPDAHPGGQILSRVLGVLRQEFGA